MNSSAHPSSSLLAGFLSPPPSCTPTPFWWWTGDRLEPERIQWQLDQLAAKGIRNAIVSYNHRADGSIDPGDPPVFSPEWWEFFRWTLDECAARGMELGIQDYCIINPLLQEIGQATPGMRGAGQLVERHEWLNEGARLDLSEVGEGTIAAWAFSFEEGKTVPLCEINLLSSAERNEGFWTAPKGDWLVSVVSLRPNPFDPAHPESGRLLIARLYEPFIEKCPEHLGKTLRVFFQDELDFGSRMPLWSARFQDEFSREHGYSPLQWLPALWHDLGPMTPKFRLDYSQTIVRLIEENYFVPVFQWHESHGTLLANDNCGRGGIEAGRAVYGDYFRTMRWFHGPGCDDPNLNAARAFKGLKVNSSIAHLYGRPKTWSECFHSSGWGTAPAEILPALDENFIYGATAISLHGLYYSTHGSWWEWAPPDFHFRQPYWAHSGSISTYISRLCYILSQGDHVCDAAIVYPSAALEGAMNPRVKNTSAIPYSEAQAGNGHGDLDAAERDAFAIAESLFHAGIDFDFVDFEALESASVENGGLRIGRESYRVLILPRMSTVRFSTLQKAREFFGSGGVVIAYGCLPAASERTGSGDPVLEEIVAELFAAKKPCSNVQNGQQGVGVFIAENPAILVETISKHIDRDFDSFGARLQTLHRRTASQDIFLVRNPAPQSVKATVRFRTFGRIEEWNAQDGSINELHASDVDLTGTRLALEFGACQSRLFVFQRGESAAIAGPSPALLTCSEIPVSGCWKFSLEPTLDNRFGDFRLAPGGLLGVEARRFRYAEETGAAGGWHRADFDDSLWPEVTASFGPRFWLLGPLPPGSGEPGPVDERWAPYMMSTRWGVENDPHLKDWASGPHGLKGAVPDEFIDLHCDQPGAVWYLWTAVEPVGAGTLPFVMGSRAAYSAWLNGDLLLDQTEELPPGRQSIWNLPHYDSVPRRAAAALRDGPNGLLLRFVQPSGQRVRAYAAFDLPPVPGLGLRWFTNPLHPVFNYRPGTRGHAGWFRFASPPGLAALHISMRGTGARVWVAGNEIPLCDGLAPVPHPDPQPVSVAIRIEHLPGSFAGDALPEAIALDCVPGLAPAGDWSKLGLATYSGMVCYRRTIVLRKPAQGETYRFDLGSVRATARVLWNGMPVGILLGPPWSVDVTPWVREGENSVEVEVANTLANHYSVGIPTPYVFAGQTVSGLLGPVTLQILRDAR